jgi:hypothetical protein
VTPDLRTGFAGDAGLERRADGGFFIFQCPAGSGASGASGGFFIFFLTLPPVRSPATDCGCWKMYSEKV